MASEKQIQANRQNAMNSTGPKSIEGKKASRLNAMKHGILAKQILISGENESEFLDIRQEFFVEFMPEGTLESTLLDQVVATFWRLHRARRVEAGIYEDKFLDQEVKQHRILRHHVKYPEEYPDEDLPGEDKWLGNPNNLRSLGNAFVTDSMKEDALGKLSRYETALHRLVQRDLRMLQHLQADRKDTGNDEPVIVDLNITDTPPAVRKRERSSDIVDVVK